MTDDEGLPARAADHGDSELLQYDFFKHLTSLVLVTLGGMLIMIKDFDPKDIKPLFVVTTIILISGSGVLAFSGSSEIVRARRTGTPPKRALKYYSTFAPLVLAAGFGLFLSMFVDSLN